MCAVQQTESTTRPPWPEIPAVSVFLREDAAKSRQQQAQASHQQTKPAKRKYVSNGKKPGRQEMAIDMETARRLYAEHNSYRKVAQIMGAHMVTIHRRLTGRRARA